MDFTQILNAVVLGIVEGVTEFLPVSSTGHLILFNRWFRFADGRFTNMFDVVIQSGAILAVILYFRKRLFPVYPGQTPEERRGILGLWLKAFIGFLPAVVVGVLAIDFIEAALMTPLVVAASLALWGAFIIVMERRKVAAEEAGEAPRFAGVKDLTIPVVVAIGFIQCLGMVPGTSRSAATIVGAMLLGASRVAAAEFSFFLAIPTIVGASGYSLLKQVKEGLHIGGPEIAVLATGTVVSFLVAWAIVAFFMNFKKHDFRVFGWYRIALGLVVLALMVFTGPLAP